MTTPTNLPPSVAHNFGDRDTVDGVIEQIGFEMNQGYLSPKNGALVKAAQDRVRELAARAADPAPVRELLLVRNGVHDRLQVTAEPSRDGSTLIVCVADPAPVADEAAIEAWERDWDAATRTLHFRIQRDEFDGVRAMGARAVRLMRAAPRNDDGRLRKLLDDKETVLLVELTRAWIRGHLDALDTLLVGLRDMHAAAPATISAEVLRTTSAVVAALRDDVLQRTPEMLDSARRAGYGRKVAAMPAAAGEQPGPATPGGA